MASGNNPAQHKPHRLSRRSADTELCVNAVGTSTRRKEEKGGGGGGEGDGSHGNWCDGSDGDWCDGSGWCNCDERNDDGRDWRDGRD
jgi:hypothetical protein